MTFNRFVTYRQLDRTDCGPTCLRMIFNHYGKQVHFQSLKKAAELGKGGVSLLNLAIAAEKYGFQTKGVKITFDQLLTESLLPCILLWNKGHFVVLTPKSTKQKIVIADPAKGIVTLKREEFLQHWIGTEETEGSSGVALVLTPGPAFSQLEDDTGGPIGWTLLAKYLLRYKPQLVQLFLGLVLGSVLQLIVPFLTQNIVDYGINSENLHFIQIILFAQFALFFSRTIVDFIRNRILLFISNHVNLSILSDFWIKLTRLPLSFFDAKRVGDIFQRIHDNTRIESFMTGSALPLIYSACTLSIFSFVLLLYNTSIFFVFIIGSILYLLWIRTFLNYRRSLDYKSFAIASKKNTITMQFIYGMQEIKLNNAEQLKRWEWEKVQTSSYKLTFKLLSLGQYQTAGAFFINEGKNLLITYIVAKTVLDGALTLGAMVAIQYIVGQMNGPIEQLVNFTQRAQDAKISLERLNEIHQLKDEEPKDETFATSISNNHTIIFSNFSFSYPGTADFPVLKNINLELPGGKTTAIVGMSGSGKTTIIKLMQKFYSDYGGEIKVGGINLRYISPYFWRSVSGSVMQEGYIFNDTIERNIAVGDEHPDFARVMFACKVANIISFIESLPLGLNTQIGGEGTGISGGQRQRLLIARVVYKNPPFIFLDEATNALDATNEMSILQNLKDVFKEKTIVVVAHRLSTIKDADKIVMLENGNIIEEGDHQALINRKGKYYELVKNQL